LEWKSKARRLRHTVAVILRECGYDERTIVDALGQKTIEMTRHYARGADLVKKMTGVAQKFGRGVNRRRTKVSNPPTKMSNLKALTEGRPSKEQEIQWDDGGRTSCSIIVAFQFVSRRCGRIRTV
jgi:hypothetical protein